MRIGNLELKNNLLLAPMAGVTDAAFRSICKEHGAGLTYSEMVSAKAMLYGNTNTEQLLHVEENERPLALQLFGSEPEVIAEMAKRAKGYGFALVDINMGCPAPKIVKNGEGSALMKNPELIGRIVNAVANAVDLPLTIKIRKGFNNNLLNAVEVAKIAEQNGAAAVAVHGRTREQYYSGTADWSIIREVKQAVNIPVFGNGDVDSPEKAKAMLDETGCDAVMIGRGAEGNPWLFERTAHYLQTGELLPEPDIKERLEVALLHAKKLIELKGEYIGCMEMRRHFCRYVKGIHGASRIRTRIIKVSSYQELEIIADELLHAQ